MFHTYIHTKDELLFWNKNRSWTFSFTFSSWILDNLEHCNPSHLFPFPYKDTLIFVVLVLNLKKKQQHKSWMQNWWFTSYFSMLVIHKVILILILMISCIIRININGILLTFIFLNFILWILDWYLILLTNS